MSKTGLDSIVERIIGDAECTAAAIKENAEGAAAEIVAAAEREAEEIIARGELEAKERAAEIKRRGEAEGEMEYRCIVLAAKQRAISNLTAAAKKTLFDSGYKGYFEMLSEMLEAEAGDMRGEILISEADRERMPRSFKRRLAEKGLTVAGGVSFGGGFILRYGGIEINCTADAVFEARREAITDALLRLLFGDGVEK